MDKKDAKFVGILLGLFYGVFAYAMWGGSRYAASITYLFLVPVVISVLPLLFVKREELKSYKTTLSTPLASILAYLLGLVLVRVEDFLCFLVLLAPFIVSGLISALVYRWYVTGKKKEREPYDKKKNNKLNILLLCIFPYLFSIIEFMFESPTTVNKVENVIYINASKEKVWENIIEVKEIREEEYNAGFFQFMGIPRPISATVDSCVLGGKRIGHFEGGLRFVETIKRMEPYSFVAFDILVDPKSVRNRVFDQHVLNGSYFSFVDASYELEEIAENKVRLTLRSNYKMTSNINFYAKFWGDLILSDFQSRLLEVIKKRCER